MSTSLVLPATAESAVETQAPARRWPVFALAGLLTLTYLPLLALHAQSLWLQPQYQFFPLGVAGALYLAWSRRREMNLLTPGPRSLGYPLIGFAWVLLAVASGFVAPWLGMVSALIVLVGLAWLLGGSLLLRATLPSVWLLALLVPPPFTLDQTLTLSLQRLTVYASSQLLDLFGVTHLLAGNVVEVPGQRLLVEEACSGIHSLMTALAGSLFFGLWRRRPGVHILVLLTATGAFVLLGNAARIALGTLLKARHDIDLLSGWPHQLVGLVIFAACLGLMLSTDQFLLFLTESRRTRGEYPEVREYKHAPSPIAHPGPAPGALRLAPLAALFGILGLVQLGTWWTRDPNLYLRMADPVVTLERVDDLSVQHGGAWQLINAETTHREKSDPLGEWSKIWRYRKGRIQASVSLDCFFPGWHELTTCYRSQGWDVQERSLGRGAVEETVRPCIEAKMQRGPGAYGYLWFGLTEDRGKWLEPYEAIQGLGQRFLTRLGKQERPAYQLQVFVSSYVVLSPEEQEQARQLFREAQVALEQRLLGGG